MRVLSGARVVRDLYSAGLSLIQMVQNGDLLVVVVGVILCINLCLNAYSGRPQTLPEFVCMGIFVSAPTDAQFT